MKKITQFCVPFFFTAKKGDKAEPSVDAEPIDVATNGTEPQE